MWPVRIPSPLALPLALPLAKRRQWLAVALKQRGAHLAAVRWLGEGPELCRVRAETALEISGLVASTIYLSDFTIAKVGS